MQFPLLVAQSRQKLINSPFLCKDPAAQHNPKLLSERPQVVEGHSIEVSQGGWLSPLVGGHGSLSRGHVTHATSDTVNVSQIIRPRNAESEEKGVFRFETKPGGLPWHDQCTLVALQSTGPT